MKTLSGEYRRGLVVVNPTSTNAKRASREVARLESRLPIKRIDSSRDSAATRESILANLRPGDILLGAGGEGMANQLGNFLMSAATRGDGLEGQTAVFLRGGYASDVATMLNGKADASEIVARGRAVKRHPLEVTVTRPDGTSASRWALGYYGIGGTGEASRRIENVKAQSNVLTGQAPIALSRKAVATLVSIGTYPEFVVAEDTKTTFTNQIAFLRGNLMGKYAHPHADLAEPEFEMLRSERPGIVPALADMLKSQRGRLYGDMTDFASFDVYSADRQPLIDHYDGEHGEIISGSTVTVAIASEGYNTLTTL